MNNKLKTAIAGALVTAMLTITVACGLPTWFITAEGIAATAVPIAGSIIQLVDPALAPVVSEVVQAFKALDSTLKSYEAQPTATNLQAIEAAAAAIQANEAQLAQAAQIKNTNTDATVAAVVQLLGSAVTEIIALIPPQAPVSAHLRLSAAQAKAHAKGLTAEDFKKTYNAVTKNDPRFRGTKFHTNPAARAVYRVF